MLDQCDHRATHATSVYHKYLPKFVPCAVRSPNHQRQCSDSYIVLSMKSSALADVPGTPNVTLDNPCESLLLFRITWSLRGFLNFTELTTKN